MERWQAAEARRRASAHRRHTTAPRRRACGTRVLHARAKWVLAAPGVRVVACSLWCVLCHLVPRIAARRGWDKGG